MGDFLLDFREVQQRRQAAAFCSTAFKFCSGTRIHILEGEAFTLVLSRVDDAELWAPYRAGSPPSGVLVALAGRVALDEEQWKRARAVEGAGGLACKAVLSLYQEGGVKALENLNGNFVALIHDEAAGKFFLITDRCGMYLAYGQENPAQQPVFSSHPDVLAAVLGENQNWDSTSFAEFLMTSRLTFPYTYYRNVRGLETASVHTVELSNRTAAYKSSRRYFAFDFKIDSSADELDLAHELSHAFKSAVQKRTLPLFGRSGVALSGGLDSRTILSAAEPNGHVVAFSLFDEQNTEFKLAKAIAEACDVELIALKRDFEHYGSSAELGVRISGGTGCITCNHFLAIRDRLAELGISNVLTGCYCDYLFKGLALNFSEAKLSRLRSLSGFDFAFYDPCIWFNTPSRDGVRERLNVLFPEHAQKSLSEQDWLNIERKRSFPLAYEQDLAQRVIPQRVMPWSLPIVDTGLLDVYLKVPPRFKLNASLFKKMVSILCPAEVCRIPNANTGASVNASVLSNASRRWLTSLRNRVTEKVSPRMVLPGSWPNWQYYFAHSKVIRALWLRPNETAQAIFEKVLGWDPFQRDIRSFTGSEIVLFQRLLTLKIWLGQRA